MKSWPESVIIARMAAVLAFPAVWASAPDPVDFFEKRIRPILVENCYECHSVESGKTKGGLLLDSREGIRKGGSNGPAVVPGEPENSLLIKAVRYVDEELQMPPKHRLTENQVANLVEWVKMGAPDPRESSPNTEHPAPIDWTKARQFWSFQPLANPALPRVKNQHWVRTPVDHFILAKLEARGFEPAPPSEKRAWLRRVTFDLTGLPPTPEEIERFVTDSSEQAAERVVDRLLASPAYGEHWGRHWLDVIRYADTAGDSSDYPVPQAGKFRDYVIQSFNADKPFNEFIVEQIAGDLLPCDSTRQKYERIIATGYIAMSRRFGVNPESVQHLTIEDTIDNLGKAFLGLTVSCARCHDHKYDPITTADYYALYGIFSSTRYPFAGSENEKRQRNLVPLLEEVEVARLMKPIRDQIAPIEEKIQTLQDELSALRKAESENPGEKPEDQRTVTTIREEIRLLRRKKDEISGKAPFMEKAFAVAEGKAADAHIQIRGEPGRNGELVRRRFLQVLGGQTVPADEPGSGRLHLARWIADPGNPLTARVLMNRVWQHHFGKGLVATPNDFGIRGKPPTHPELLDFLARKLIEGGWSLKAMHRLIVLSQTYRQSSIHPRDYSVQDPNNELLWKFDRRRLEAEAVRDGLLAVSGTLERPAKSTHPFPPEDKWTYTQHAPFQAVYRSNQRSVYLMQQRIKKHPFLELFDGADPNASTAARKINITPLQALFLMNDPFAHEKAQAFARRILESSQDEAARLQFAHECAFGRPATPLEMERLGNYLRVYREKLAGQNVPAENLPLEMWSSVARVLFSGNEFVFVD